jgi:hypothetical protein
VMQLRFVARYQITTWVNCMYVQLNLHRFVMGIALEKVSGLVSCLIGY